MTIMSDVKVENLLGIFGFQRKLFPLHPGVSSFTPAIPSGIRGKYLICKEPNQQLQNWNEEEMEGEDTEAGQHQLYQEDHVFCCRHSWTPLAPALPKLWLFTFYLDCQKTGLFLRKTFLMIRLMLRLNSFWEICIHFYRSLHNPHTYLDRNPVEMQHPFPLPPAPCS